MERSQTISGTKNLKGFFFAILLFGSVKSSLGQFYGADFTYSITPDSIGSGYAYKIQLKVLLEGNVVLPDTFYGYSKTDSLDRCDSLKTYFFEREKSYSGSGTYWIAFEDSTRDRIALNAPGLDSGYSCAAELVYSPFYEQGSTIRFRDKPHLKVEKGDTLRYHPAFADQEGDSLSFGLRQLDDSSGYWIPNGVEVNPKSGEFLWTTPDSVGHYEFTMEAKEFWNGSYKGRVWRNFTVKVLDSLDSQGRFIEQGGFSSNSNGYLERRVKPGDTLELDLSFVDDIADSVALEAVGEPFSQASSSSFSSSQNDSLSDASFSWVPDSTDLRQHAYPHPYILTFIGKSYPSCTWYYKTVMIYVESDSATSIAQRTQERELELFPNPAGEVLRLRLSESIEEGNARIYNTSGQLLEKRSFSGRRERLDIDGLEPGIYFFSLRTEEGSYRERFIVK